MTADPDDERPAADAEPLRRDVHRSPDYMAQVAEAIRAGDETTVHELIDPLHPADLADLFETLSSSERRSLARLLGPGLQPDFLSELEGQVFGDVASELDPGTIAQALQRFDTDDAVYIVEELDPAVKDEVLKRLARADRAAIEEGLAYPEESAGRLMQKQLVAVPQFWTVGQTIDFMRAQKQELPADFYEIIVTDPFFRVVGTVPLSHIMRAKRKVSVADLMNADPHLVDVMADQEEVAYDFNKYHLISAPVVNAQKRLVGVITVDDIVLVVEQEAQEDILALAGVSEGGVNESTWKATRARFWWLLINLGTAVLASAVIGLFDATISSLVALAVLMPIVASMGGNGGTQTMTVAVRALATRELSASNAWRIVRKELSVNFLNGLAMAVVVSGVTLVWFGQPKLAAIIAVAMVINMAMAGLAGIGVPMVLDRMKVDPAIASSVFVTTITDVVGFFAFLGLAALLLA